MEFKLDDYKEIVSLNGYIFPKNFLPFSVIDRKKYSQLERERKKKGMNIADTFGELRSRTSIDYFREVYPAQSAALNFSETSFPAYRFLMPDVLANDWLAIVDFHKKHSRDHALHQPLTAYVVYKLLGGGNASRSLSVNGSNLLDLCIDKIFKSPKASYLFEFFKELGGDPSLCRGSDLNRSIWRALFFETAMVAAVFHDIGYPWQYIGRLNKTLSSSSFIPGSLSSDADHICTVFKDRMIMMPFHGYKRTKGQPHVWSNTLLSLISQSLSSTHGFPGALGYLHLNDCVRQYPCEKDTTFQNFCIEWAALGIMMHDMGGVYWNKNDPEPNNEFLRLQFDKDPLSCIVALADVLEDFHRPTVGFEANHDRSHFIYGYSCLSTLLELKDSIMNITYRFSNDDDRVANFVWKQDEERAYFDPSCGYLDLSSIGIERVRIHCKKI